MSLQDLTDDGLVQRCRDGDPAAWSTLVRRFQRLVFTVPRRAGLAEHEAADVFQFCFAQLFEHLDRIDDPSRVRAWLVTTARHETLRLLRERSRHAALPAGDDDSAEDPIEALADPAPLQDEALQALQESDRLRAAVDRLDLPSRRFVELMFLQDDPLPYGEVARRLGIAEGSIGPTRARCFDKLRRLLRQMR